MDIGSMAGNLFWRPQASHRERLRGGTGDSQVNFATFRAPRRRKAGKPAPIADPRPTPAFGGYLSVAGWFHLWNCLLFGSWTEFDSHRLLEFYGLSWDSPTSSATC